MSETSKRYLRLNLQEVPDNFSADSPVGSIRDFWKSLQMEEALPHRRDIGMDRLRPWLGWVSLIDGDLASRRFRWRLIGSKITALLGRDATGQWFDDLYDGEVLEGYRHFFSLSLERRSPVFLAGDVEFLDKKHILFDSVHLPLVDTGPGPDLILLCADMRLASGSGNRPIL